MNKAIALIPARAGSVRVPDKNIRFLDGHPLIAYTISAAVQSGVFDRVLVSTDSEQYAKIARHYGAEVPFLRPAEIAGSKSPDIEWVEFTLNELKDRGDSYRYFSVLRPTSPFRQVETIQRAWKVFQEFGKADSLRAVEVCSQHPGKMWVVRGEIMYPVMPVTPPEQPWHSSQFAALPEVFVQNASLEIARVSVIENGRTIAGEIIQPFITEGFEGFDINQEVDWVLAEYYMNKGEAKLPEVSQQPYERQSEKEK
jgi:CMP-N,N'-diacetyllegionaminic acid synthase